MAAIEDNELFLPLETTDSEFLQYCAFYGKQYKNIEEYQKRRQLFLQSMEELKKLRA